MRTYTYFALIRQSSQISFVYLLDPFVCMFTFFRMIARANLSRSSRGRYIYIYSLYLQVCK